jgi:hypothetical protein
MDRAVFTEEILKQILFLISATERQTAKIIEARKGRVDQESFKKWLFEEREKMLNSPDLVPFDLVQKGTMGTPEKAANELAGFIQFHLGVHLKDGVVVSNVENIDWAEMLKHGVRILSGNLTKDPGFDHNLRTPFVTYYKALKAETTATVFGRYIEGNNDPRPLFPYFHSSEKLSLAIQAAFKTGLINENEVWGHIGEKTKAVTMFWRAAVKMGLAKADAPVYKVVEAIKAQFSVSFGQNAIISTKQKKEIADFGEDYKELYKALCEIMRP